MPNSRRNTRMDVDRREVAAVLKSRLDEECAPPLGARPSRARRTRVKVLVTNGNATGSTHRGLEGGRRHAKGGGSVLSSVGVGRIKEERLPPRHRGVRSFRLTAVVNSEMNNRDAKVNNERLLTSATRTMSLKNQESAFAMAVDCARPTTTRPIPDQESSQRCRRRSSGSRGPRARKPRAAASVAGRSADDKDISQEYCALARQRRENRPPPRGDARASNGTLLLLSRARLPTTRMVSPPAVATPLNHRAAARARPRVV